MGGDASGAKRKCEERKDVEMIRMCAPSSLPRAAGAARTGSACRSARLHRWAPIRRRPGGSVLQADRRSSLLPNAVVPIWRRTRRGTRAACVRGHRWKCGARRQGRRAAGLPVDGLEVLEFAAPAPPVEVREAAPRGVGTCVAEAGAFAASGLRSLSPLRKDERRHRDRGPRARQPPARGRLLQNCAACHMLAEACGRQPEEGRGRPHGAAHWRACAGTIPTSPTASAAAEPRRVEGMAAQPLSRDWGGQRGQVHLAELARTGGWAGGAAISGAGADGGLLPGGRRSQRRRAELASVAGPLAWPAAGLVQVAGGRQRAQAEAAC